MKDDEIPQTGESASAPMQGLTNPPHRILVVEDDDSIRLLITTVLVRSGYHVDAAEDGAAGWEALQAKHYDLLVTDNSMPKVSGVEMVKLLRSQDATLPVIVASGAIPTEQLKRHAWLAISAILLKPYTITELLGTVQEVLQGAESTRNRTESNLPEMTGAGAQSGPLTRGAAANEQIILRLAWPG